MERPNCNQTEFGRGATTLGPVLFFGFATALAIWCVWFVTHLPWLEIPEHVSMPVLLAIWLVGMVWSGLGRAAAAAARVGLGSGILTAVLGLAVLGSKIAEPAPGFEGLNPGLLLVAGGFLTLGAVIGLAGGTAGSAVGSFCARRGAGTRTCARGSLGDFGILTVLSLVPLLVIGGMVTSTASGMAVPDWPNTFGTNMFLYPLGPRAAPDVYFEHAHRLFGTFVGLATLVLMVWVLVADPRRWVRIMGVLAFALVCLQGLLGGLRVLRGSVDVAQDPILERMVHGVLAQLVFALIVAIAVVLTPTFKNARAAMVNSAPVLNARVLRFVSTGLLHATLLQLVLGAAYRHTRNTHSLWSHATFSIIVVIFAVAAGSAAAALVHAYGGIGPILRRTGRWIIIIIAIQFLLGWVSFAFGGHALQPDTAWQALIRTSHQANGALLLALATIAYVWMKRLLWAERNAGPLASGPGVSPAAPAE